MVTLKLQHMKNTFFNINTYFIYEVYSGINFCTYIYNINTKILHFSKFLNIQHIIYIFVNAFRLSF